MISTLSLRWRQQRGYAKGSIRIGVDGNQWEMKIMLKLIIFEKGLLYLCFK
jgi:hypothetical protein